MSNVINMGSFDSVDDAISAIMGIDDVQEEEIPRHNEWILADGVYYPAKDTVIKKQLAPGHYEIIYDRGKFSVEPINVDTDDLYKLPNDNINKIISELDVFWSKKELFEKEGFVHKRGILLHGHPGAGKSSTIARLTKSLIENGGLVFTVTCINDLNVYTDFIHMYLRVIQPDTPIITIIEDIDKLVNQDESYLLNYLDGVDQFEHNVTIATTNRITELNDLLLRPSRFDWVMEIELPDEEVRRFFLEKRGVSDEELDMWSKDTDKLSMAELKELYLSVKILGNDYVETLMKIRDQSSEASKNTTFKSKAKSKSIGFGSN